MALFEVVGSYAFFDIHNTEFPPLAAAANVRLATNRPQSHWLSFFVQSPSVTNSLFPMTPAPKSVPHLPRPIASWNTLHTLVMSPLQAGKSNVSS